MSHPRVMRPILGASSRLLLEVSKPTTAPPRRLISHLQSRVPRPSVCPSCSLSRPLRFSSTNSKPPPESLNGEPRAPDPQAFSSAASGEASQPPPPGPETSTGPDTSREQPAPSSVDPNPNLPSHSESRRSALSHRFSSFMDSAQSSLFAASQRLNDLTGYSGIETLKSQIAGLESGLGAAQARLHAARAAYKAKVAERSATQREVTTLLARQKTWDPTDFERFTTLYRQDHELEAAVAAGAAELEGAERDAERLGRELSTGILARYHEEQIWSDKIRRMSTWGTWGLMGVNVLLFLVFQFGAEPWRRARLVRGFEEKVREALEEERARDRLIRAEDRAADRAKDAGVAAAAAPVVVEAVSVEREGLEPVAAELKAVEADTAPVKDTPALSWREMVTQPDRWKAAAADLASDRTVAVRMRDISLVALEGVAAGAVVAGTIAVLFIRTA